MLFGSKNEKGQNQLLHNFTFQYLCEAIHMSKILKMPKLNFIGELMSSNGKNLRLQNVMFHSMILLKVIKGNALQVTVYLFQKTESVIAFATVLNNNRTLKALNLNRPILFSEQEETTIHFAKMLKVNWI